MKVVSVGMGQNVFEQGSAVRQRMIDYGQMFDELHLIVFAPIEKNYKEEKLSSNVYLYPSQSKNRILFLFDYLKIAKKILSKSNKKDFVVTAQDPFETGLVGLVLKLLYRLPLQIQLHTDFLNQYFIKHTILNFLRFPIGIFVLSFADSVRCVSERVAKSIRAIANNVSVLPILVDNNNLPQVERAVRSGRVNILTVCRLEKEKDLTTAIKAFKMVCELGIDAEFVIVGDGGEREMLENLAKIYNLQTKIHFVGWQNDLQKYYEDADIYLSTSLYEGYGMSTVEAASFGLPLVITDAGVACFMFKDRESAFVCKQGGVEALAEAIVLLAKDPNLRLEMGLLARKNFEENRIDRAEYFERYKASLLTAYNFYQTGGFFEKNILFRYVAAGLTGAGTQIGLLYIFTDLVKIWYIYSSIIAFIVAIIVSFLLQKFWTFKDRTTQQIHHQAIKYLATAITGLIVNTVLMYLFVDLIGIWYILAQIIIGAIIMVFNFLMYKFVVFKKK